MASRERRATVATASPSARPRSSSARLRLSAARCRPSRAASRRSGPVPLTGLALPLIRQGRTLASLALPLIRHAVALHRQPVLPIRHAVALIRRALAVSTGSRGLAVPADENSVRPAKVTAVQPDRHGRAYRGNTVQHSSYPGQDPDSVHPRSEPRHDW
jgi:hypothetical protein